MKSLRWAYYAEVAEGYFDACMAIGVLTGLLYCAGWLVWALLT